MIAIDTNILVYAHRADSPFHGAAFNVMRDLIESDMAWAIPWPCVHEFLAKVTHARIFKHPTPLERALAQVEEWLRSPSGRVIAEPAEYLGILSGILRSSQAVGSKVHDARIAALCLAHGVDELWSADRDFSRFTSLKARNPLHS